jgi:uncharacterized SAM-binding protein YcdF (DUF218 family)
MSDPLVGGTTTQRMTASYDVAVVLGAAVRPDGQPSPALERRIAYGITLYRQGRTGHLLLSGGCVGSDLAEAELMRCAALDAGVPEAALSIEDRSRNTLENAKFCRPIIALGGWRRILLVTDHHHLPRSLYTFRRFGIAATAAPVPPPPWDGPLLAAYAREMAAFLIYLWRIERALHS